jgi:hypothetical protein
MQGMQVVSLPHDSAQVLFFTEPRFGAGQSAHKMVRHSSHPTTEI